MIDGVNASELDRYVDLQRPVADNALDGAGSGGWAIVDRVWAGIKELPAGRSEKADSGFTRLVRSARIRMRYREDVAARMRVVDGETVWQIVSDPIMLGRRGGVEFLGETQTPAGNPA